MVARDGFPYGYRKLTVCLQENYDLQINHKKVYKLCKELNILKQKHPLRLAKREKIYSTDQLWKEKDMKISEIWLQQNFMKHLKVILQKKL
ncbi:hypothetical protein BBF96_11475 [Anoxybacter fermentans]|uniref:HTH-like domain-containing protein n=1 Tax=Anoxybacter fermentans TaxID=1323375 RepID=A0A3Q9HRH4_9FIRM|nr:IS3 family transposase [Anoxybacter fermentans]AZR73956.1 hypothetical protein BBF96_11475 [Anoxybacter fermentans]